MHSGMANTDRHPVVKMLLLVSVVIGVMIALIPVVFDIHLVFVEVSSHSDSSIHVLQLWVVVEWNGGEWVEAVWVNFNICYLSIQVISLGLKSLFLPIGLTD